MTQQGIQFRFLDRVIQRIIANHKETTYLTANELMVPGGTTEQLGRFDCNAAQAKPFLERELAALRGENEEEGDGDYQGPEQELEEDHDTLGMIPAPDLKNGKIDSKDVAIAACRWVRQVAMDVSIGRDEGVKFKILLYNGVSCRSVNFQSNKTGLGLGDNLAENINRLSADPNYSAKGIEEVVVGATYAGFMQSMQKFTHINIDATERLIQIQHTLFDRVTTMYLKSQDREAKLIEIITTLHESAAERSKDVDENEARLLAGHSMAKEGMGLLGQVATAMLGKGLSPEAQTLMGAVAQNPGLATKLQDPRVINMLKNPEAVEFLGGLLEEVASQISDGKLIPAGESKPAEIPNGAEDETSSDSDAPQED